MENMNIYENIGRRTGGDIYLGIVGPVRAGKSTFIKRFMDLMVLPNISDTYEKQRIIDEIPQSGTGKTITTTEPKFIPAEAVELKFMGSKVASETGNMRIKVRLVDCVGYMIPGAIGHMEEDEPRMVATPWSDDKLPFAQAAEIGTEKVIKDHSTVGIVITTDGTINTMERADYREAEEKVIKQLFEIRKPFVVIMNSTDPEGIKARREAAELEEKFGIPVIRMDCARASETEINEAMMSLLGRFPVRQVAFRIPGYVEGIDNDHWLKAQLIENIKYWAQGFETVDDIKNIISALADGEIIKGADIKKIDMGSGEVELQLDLADDLYYKVVTELMGQEITSDRQFFSLLREFSQGKKEYDKLRSALQQVEECGYGIVEPEFGEMSLDAPEVFKQGNKYGIKIKAKAPTLHMIKTDITTEVSPVVGSEKQSEDLVASLKEEMVDSPDGIWNTNIFGKSLHEMVEEQMESKLAAVPETVRNKMQKSLQKISDEGKEYFICIVI